MTIDERVNDVMAKLKQWVDAGQHRPLRWDGEECNFVYIGDDELRLFMIRKIVEASRQDGIEAEREACAEIAYREVAIYAEGASPEDLHGYPSEFREVHNASKRIAQKIRSRSEGKGEPKSLLTFDSVCMCGHVMSDHGAPDNGGNYGGCLGESCQCQWFCAQSSS